MKVTIFKKTHLSYNQVNNRCFLYDNIRVISHNKQRSCICASLKCLSNCQYVLYHTAHCHFNDRESTYERLRKADYGYLDEREGSYPGDSGPGHHRAARCHVGIEHGSQGNAKRVVGRADRHISRAGQTCRESSPVRDQPVFVGVQGLPLFGQGAQRAIHQAGLPIGENRQIHGSGFIRSGTSLFSGPPFSASEEKAQPVRHRSSDVSGMEAGMKENQAFFSWVNSQACWDLLLRCARARRQFKSMTEDAIEDLAGSLWMVLRTSLENPRGKLFVLIDRQDWRGLERYLKKKGKSLLKEQKRDKYYQRVRQALSATKDMGYTVVQGYGYFGSMREGAERTVVYDELLKQGFRPTFPPVAVDDVRSAKTIIELAKNFRSQVEDHLGYEVRIPVRELCSYIRKECPQGTEYDPVSDHTIETEGDTPIDERPDPDESSDPHRVKHSDQWLTLRADCIARQLDDLDLLLVFCLKYHCDMVLREMAAALELSGPSHVSYVLEKVHRELRLLLSLEDGLGKEDFNENLFGRFHHKLLAHCKDEDCSRSTHKKADQTRSDT